MKVTRKNLKKKSNDRSDGQTDDRQPTSEQHKFYFMSQTTVLYLTSIEFYLEDCAPCGLVN